MNRTMPGAAGDLAETYPDVWKGYSALGEAVAGAGPLTERERIGRAHV